MSTRTPYSRTFKAGILASGQVLASLAGLLSAAVLSRIFSRHDYATYRQTLLAFLFVSPILLLGLPQALYYFLPGETQRRRAILLENLLLLAGLACLFPLFVGLGGNRFLAAHFNNPDLSRTLLLIAPYSLLIIPLAVLPACLMARDRPKTVAIFNVASRLTILGFVLGVVVVRRSPEAALVGTMVGMAIAFGPALRLMWRACPSLEWRPRISGMWSQLRYSVPLGMATMIATITLGLDKIIVSSFCDPEVFAIYINGAIEVPFVTLIASSATAVILPEIVKRFKAGQKSESLDLWRRATRKCGLLVLPLMVFLFVTAVPVVRVLFSKAYTESAVPFRIYLLVLPLRITLFGTLLMAAGKNHWILFRSVIELLCNAVISVLLVKRFGYLGAAFGTVLTLWLWSLPFNLTALVRVTGVKSIREILPIGYLAKVLVLSVLSAVPLYGLMQVKVLGDGMQVGLGALVYGAVLLVGLDRSGLVPAVLIKQQITDVFKRRQS